MKAHDWFIEHRTDYAARALESDDEGLFRDHLARCAECRAAIAELERDLAWLPMGVAPVPVRPWFTRSVVERILQSRWRRRWVWPAVAAAAVVVAVGIWQRDQTRIAALVQELGARDAQLAATRDTLVAALGTDRVLQTSIELNGKRGGMLILADEATHRWKVVVHGIPAAREGERYTFWFITADGMVRGAEVICDELRPAVLMLDMPPGARFVKGGSLTIEPKTGDLSVPRGRELAHLEL